MPRRRFPDVLRALRWYDYAVVIGGLFVVAWLGQLPDPAPRLYDAETRIIHYGDRKMRDAAREAFVQDFATGAYFGAFYQASDGAYGWATGHNSPQAAQANALAHCAQYAEDCTLKAELLPAGWTECACLTLRAEAARSFADYLQGSGARAFAKSENGASGWAAGHATIWSAKSAALDLCEDRRAKNQPTHLPDWPCRVVDARWR
jgi:hypothetical protein